MSQKRSVMLFGGALMCAGLHATTADPQVSGVSIEYTGDVSNLFAYDPDGPYTPSYVDTGVNESFSVSGGTDVLPFNRLANGGGPYDNGYFLGRETVTVAGEGSLSSSGAFEFSGSAGAGSSYASEFDDFGSSITIEFSVASPSPFEIVASGFFDNDFGFSSVSLRASDGTFLLNANTVPAFDETLTGTLQPDTYTLSLRASVLGDANVQISVVPAPMTSALLALGGALALRRRR